MDSNEKITYLRKCIALLEEAVVLFNKRIHQPNWDGRHFRYKDPNPYTFLVLKMARMVTGFYSALLLTQKGLFEDAGAVHRVIIECSHDIDFVMEGLTQDPFPEDKQKLVDNFFQNDNLTPEQMLSTMRKQPTIPRKKIYPTVGRFLSPENPDRPQRIVKVIEELFSGYVHAAYPHVMEMYEGKGKEFQMRGIEALIPEWIKQLALRIHPALNQFSLFAKPLSLAKLADDLVAARKELEQSELYGRPNS